MTTGNIGNIGNNNTRNILNKRLPGLTLSVLLRLEDLVARQKVLRGAAFCFLPPPSSPRSSFLQTLCLSSLNFQSHFPAFQPQIVFFLKAAPFCLLLVPTVGIAQVFTGKQSPVTLFFVKLPFNYYLIFTQCLSSCLCTVCNSTQYIILITVCNSTRNV